MDGEVAHLGQRIIPSDAHVEVDGVPVSVPRGHHYLAVHKPRGTMTTCDDERGRRTVMDVVAAYTDRHGARLYPVGRLDKESEGLIILTDDGALAYRLLHPSYRVQKVYEVEVRGHPGRKVLQQMTTGVSVGGRTMRAVTADVVERRAATTLLRIVLSEGRKRQIRVMFGALGFSVTQLIRTAIGPIELGELVPGGFRRLTKEEVEALRATISGKRE